MYVNISALQNKYLFPQPSSMPLLFKFCDDGFSLAPTSKPALFLLLFLLFSPSQSFFLLFFFFFSFFFLLLFFKVFSPYLKTKFQEETGLEKEGGDGWGGG